MPRAGPQLRRANNNVTTRLAGHVRREPKLSIIKVDMRTAILGAQQTIFVCYLFAGTEPDPRLNRERTRQCHIGNIKPGLASCIKHSNKSLKKVLNVPKVPRLNF